MFTPSTSTKSSASSPRVSAKYNNVSLILHIILHHCDLGFQLTSHSQEPNTMSTSRRPGGNNLGEGFTASLSNLTQRTNNLEVPRTEMRPQTPVSSLPLI